MGRSLGMSTWDSHGLALLLLHRSSMEVPYVQYHWNSPCAFYGIGWGLIIGNSMAWLYGQCIGIPWACIGGCSLRIPWLCFMGRSLGCPHGTPMELHGYC